MFTNDDKQFLTDLNNSLADSFSKAMGAGPGKGSSGGGSSPVEENTNAIKGNTIRAKAVGAAFATGAAAFKFAVSKLEGSVRNSFAFGDVLARSALSTGRGMQLMGSKFDSTTRTFTNELPQINQTFAKFGIGSVQMGRILDAGIRANVENMGKNTRNFLATSVGLGNNLNTTTRFLATQTNVLGMNTEASLLFGESILAATMANGLVADEFLAAVDSFAAKSKESVILFGKESTDAANKLGSNIDVLTRTPGAGGDLVRAISSSFTDLVALQGTLGIAGQIPADINTPQQMNQLVLAAAQGLANFEERLGDMPAFARIRILEQFQSINSELFSASTLTTARRVGEELKKQNLQYSNLVGEMKLSEKAVEDYAEALVRNSKEAADARLDQTLFSNTIQGSREALDNFNKIIPDLPKEINAATKAIAELTATLQIMGVSIGSVIGGILAILGGKSLLQFLKHGGKGIPRGKVGGPVSVPPTGGMGLPRGGVKMPMSRPDMINALTPKQMKDFGITRTPTGNLSITKEGAKRLGQQAGTLSNASLEKLMKPKGLLGRGVGAVGKVGGPLAFAIPAGLEYMHSGDKSRSFARALGDAGPAALAGAAGGAFFGPPGALIGGGIGLVGSIFGGTGEKAVQLHDSMGFYEDQEMVSDIMNPATQAQVEEGLDLQQIQTELLEGIYQNTLGTNMPGEESTRFRFSTPPEWQRSSGGYFTSPTQR